MSQLKAYYFEYKIYKNKSRDIGIIATTKKDAIDSMGQEIEDYFKSKIKIIEFKIESIEKRVFRNIRFNIHGKHEEFIDEDIQASASWDEVAKLEFADDEKTKIALFDAYQVLLDLMDGGVQ